MNESGEVPAERALWSCWGEIAASLSHDINNVLATVKELAGLEEDILGMENVEEHYLRERISSAASRIGEQVDRGEILVRQLNEFAHVVDRAAVRLDVAEHLDFALGLCGRMLKLKDSTIALSAPEPGMRIRCDRYGFYALIYKCVGWLLRAGKREVRIELGAEVSQGWVLLVFLARAEGFEEGEDRRGECSLEGMAGVLGGRASVARRDNGAVILKLGFPVQRRGCEA